MLYGVLQCLNYLTDAAERLSNLSGVEIAFEYTDDYDDEEDNEDDEEEEDEDEEGEDEEGQEGETPTGDAPRRPVYITRDQIMQLLGHAGLGRIFASDLTPRQVRRRNMRVMEDEEDAEEDEDEEDAGGGSTRKNLRSRRPRGKVEFEKVPSEQGQVLMIRRHRQEKEEVGVRHHAQRARPRQRGPAEECNALAEARHDTRVGR
jgi:WD repeat-containing protein 23